MTNLEKWRDYQLDFFDDNDEIVDSINTNELIDIIEKQEKILNALKRAFKNKILNLERFIEFDVDIKENRYNYNIVDFDGNRSPLSEEEYSDLMKWLNNG